MSIAEIKKSVVEAVNEAGPALKEMIGSENSIVPVIVVVVISGPIAIGREVEKETSIERLQ